MAMVIELCYTQISTFLHDIHSCNLKLNMQRSTELVGAFQRAGAALASPAASRQLSTLVEKFTFGRCV